MPFVKSNAEVSIHDWKVSGYMLKDGPWSIWISTAFVFSSGVAHECSGRTIPCISKSSETIHSSAVGAIPTGTSGEVSSPIPYVITISGPVEPVSESWKEAEVPLLEVIITLRGVPHLLAV